LTKTLPVFDVYFLSDFNNGVVSSVLLSQKLITTLSFVINSFFSVLFFTQISSFAADKHYDKLYEMLLIGIKSMIFISIPIIFFLLHNTDEIFHLLFAYGKFSNNDSAVLSISFKYFLLGLPAIATGSIISYAIYSLQNLKIFYISSVIELIVYIGTAFFLKKDFGQNAIPLAFIINFVISDLILFIFLKYQINKNLIKKYLPQDFYKLLIATIVFIPYYLYSNPASIILDLLYFLFSFLFYITLLFKINFTPILYLFRKLFKIEK
jgi:putative peptidoglycan lipid II flippase